MNRYLIIEKEQRIETENKYPYAIQRIFGELDKKGEEYSLVYYKDIEIILDNPMEILVNGERILNFTHIIFRGHSLGSQLEYETKRIVINYIEQHNSTITENEIKIQNKDAIKLIPYYDKIYITSLCIQNDIPVGKTYYRANSEELVKQNHIEYPLIAKQYLGVNDLRLIDEKEKVKKNVYLLNTSEDFNQEHLKDKDLNEYILQEFIESGEDMRIFVSKGVAVSGFIRKATTGFMTVNKGEYTYVDFDKDPDIKELAEKVAKILKADFIAVDFMRKSNNELVLIEISLNPGFKAFETKTEGIETETNLAKVIVESF